MYGAFTPDGARILAAGTEMARPLGCGIGQVYRFLCPWPDLEMVSGGGPAGPSLSPDGARILTISTNNSAELLDATSGELVASFPHQDEVFQAEFSPDGARILTASRDKTAKLWDAASGKPIVSFEHPAWSQSRGV